MRDRQTRDAVARVWPCYKRFRAYLRPYRRHFVLGVVIIFGVAVTNTAMIWFIGTPFDLLNHGDYERLFEVLWWFGGLVVVNQCFHYAGSLNASWLGLRFIGRLRGAAFERLLQVTFPVAGQYPKGDLLARLSNDVDGIQRLVVETPLWAVSHLFTLAFYVTMLVWIDWRLALLALVLTPVFYFQQRLFAGRKQRAAQGFYLHNGRLLGFEEEALGNLRGISAFNAEPLVTDRQSEVFEQARCWGMKERRVDAAFATSFSLLIYLCGLVILFFGLRAVLDGSLSVGYLVSFLLYLGYLSVPVRGLAHLPFQCQGDVAAAERVDQLLSAAPLVSEVPGARALQVGAGEIALAGVSFAYPGGDLVYRDIDLTIAGGETVALVGPSGSGKTTFGLLLMRFYDPQAGTIKIDGHDLKAVSLASLRQNIAVVWQGPVLINDTLRANLLLARPDAGGEALVEACKASGAWEFIAELPRRLDTRIGAGGIELSVGQAQRLAIAQAFLRDAPILLLDEASSALDSESERLLVAALDRLRHGRTTLIIAHRYSSIRGADRVIYFNGDGTIAAGRHDELLRNHPGYQRAVEWQVGAEAL